MAPSPNIPVTPTEIFRDNVHQILVDVKGSWFRPAQNLQGVEDRLMILIDEMYSHGFYMGQADMSIKNDALRTQLSASKSAAINSAKIATSARGEVHRLIQILKGIQKSIQEFYDDPTMDADIFIQNLELEINI